MGLASTIQRTLDAVLYRSPAQPLSRWRTSGRLAVLAYHDVPDAAAFAWQVDYLRKHMHPVSMAEVAAAIGAGRRLPPRAVLITFDDGDRSVHDQALPVLESRGIPAVVFVVAGLLGTDTPFWWRDVEDLLRRGARASTLPSHPAACVAALKRMRDDERRAAIEKLRMNVSIPSLRQPQLRTCEIVRLEAGGVSIGNHTFSHPCLDQCGDEAVESEIRRAHQVLSGVLGKAPTAFAFPNGNVDPRASRILAELGYAAAFVFDHRVGAFPPTDRFAISRIRVGASTSRNRFRILISGLHSSVHHLMGRV